MKLIPKYQEGRDVIRDYRPKLVQPIERTVNGKKWSALNPKERFMNRSGFQNGRPIEKGLEIVSPEFDVLTGVRGLANLPKGFLKGSGKVNLKPNNFYRQTRRIDKGIERAKSLGVIDTKQTVAIAKPVKGIQLQKPTFEVPFFQKGNLWFGRNNKFDVVVGNDKLDWMPITKRGGFRPDAKNIEDAYVRATPLVNGKPNVAPSSNFEFYRHYPAIGMRNVTNGFPTMPITGLNTTSNINKQ